MVQGESERSLLQNSEAPTGVGSHGGRPTVGASSPSMPVGSARAYFAVYHRVPLRENLREKAKCTLGPNSLLREKKSVHLAPTLPFGKKKTVHSAPTLPFGRKKKCTPGPNSPQGEKRRLDGAGGRPRGVPEAYVEGELLRDGKNESVHLAPTLLRESWGDLTVRGGLRAVSQRLISKGGSDGARRLSAQPCYQNGEAFPLLWGHSAKYADGSARG